jgi:hypothetical protein
MDRVLTGDLGEYCRKCRKKGIKSLRKNLDDKYYI